MPEEQNKEEKVEEHPILNSSAKKEPKNLTLEEAELIAREQKEKEAKSKAELDASAEAMAYYKHGSYKADYDRLDDDGKKAVDLLLESHTGSDVEKAKVAKEAVAKVFMRNKPLEFAMTNSEKNRVEQAKNGIDSYATMVWALEKLEEKQKQDDLTNANKALKGEAELNKMSDKEKTLYMAKNHDRLACEAKRKAYEEQKSKGVF